MNIERLRKIIAYSDKNHDEIYSMIKRFCSFAGIEYDSDLLNVLQIVRSSFQKKGFLVLEIPFADDEIGALCYKGDGLGYVVKVEFSDDHYYEHEEEYAANLFAGMLLMPEISFRRMYLKFKEESDSNEVDTIIRLMAYYEVPFMAVLIRCLELRLIAGNAVTEGLLNHDRTQIKQKLADLWLDEAIMEPSKKDDYLHVEAIVKKFGKKYVEDGYINERTLDKVLHNMRELYQKIRRE